MNKVLLTGRLTRDPEMRSLSSGKAVTQFSIATNEYIGQGKEKAEYHNIVTWDRLAQTCGEFLGKGQQVADRGPAPDPELGRRPRPAALEDGGRREPRRDAVGPAEEGLRRRVGGERPRRPGRRATATTRRRRSRRPASRSSTTPSSRPRPRRRGGARPSPPDLRPAHSPERSRRRSPPPRRRSACRLVSSSGRRRPPGRGRARRARRS